MEQGQKSSLKLGTSSPRLASDGVTGAQDLIEFVTLALTARVGAYHSPRWMFGRSQTKPFAPPRICRLSAGTNILFARLPRKLEDKLMTNQDLGRNPPSDREREGLGQQTARTANQALAGASAMAGDAATQARQAASDTAATVTEQVKHLLDRQVETGAEAVGHLAGAVKRGAQELERDSPQLASLMRTAADRMDDYAHGMRDQSVDQLMRAASDFTRRQPAMVFGLAALAGFFAMRTLKATPTTVSSPSIQPSHPERAGNFHGS